MARDNAPPPDGWVCEPHAWNAERCCPPECLTVLPTEAHIERGTN